MITTYVYCTMILQSSWKNIKQYTTNQKFRVGQFLFYVFERKLMLSKAVFINQKNNRTAILWTIIHFKITGIIIIIIYII